MNRSSNAPVRRSEPKTSAHSSMVVRLPPHRFLQPMSEASKQPTKAHPLASPLVTVTVASGISTPPADRPSTY